MNSHEHRTDHSHEFPPSGKSPAFAYPWPAHSKTEQQAANKKLQCQNVVKKWCPHTLSWASNKNF
ncbi:hypothetical protein LX82_03598 [Celeribacter halophilus]|uniref:Uncharacterized protein n=1 Tax=Celeribacter halophilus TaxID=576117 RepID=A0A1I3WXQ5_9RHOB|nr:hypothetical protein LX82_03598 [Celeribacter halophilus]SFK11919.1 hypothetical protein SAMN04488138_13313 [Celeribacter halophilus]